MVLVIRRPRTTSGNVVVPGQVERGTRSPSRLPFYSPPGFHPKMTIATDSGLKVTVPLAPQQVQHDGFGPAYTALPRPGRKPMILSDGPEARSHQFDLTVINTRDPEANVEEVLAQLERIRASGARCTISLSRLEQGLWRMSALTITSAARQHYTNAITRATVSLTFLEVLDPVVAVGPLTGGAVVAPATPAPSTPAAQAAPAPEQHTVARGETLSAIAVRYYGRADRYRDIAAASNVSNPNLIHPGQVLTIPRP